ncbi:hypothetical protein ACFOUP_16955 [Belliella kenyensis]|uniref:Outer membrane protein beta-barrel domain-containing protein n=1 Tax=Belliella kenyensis TaxID=1472724 RepID=A0ABV8EP63_9BACT|nr:hypothetical protein [Belliella kenyensis]MCH7402861.1 hypothetical protein [Belliella kenyensis]MDN3602567.1 hypothetical protein [Belliella kenyensis]
MKRGLFIIVFFMMFGNLFSQEQGEVRLMAGGDYRLTIKEVGTFVGGEYFFADRLAIAPTFTVWFPQVGNSLNLNMDLKYYLSEGVSQVYLLAGYSNYWINLQPGNPGVNQQRSGANFGAGAFIKATEQFGFVTEFKMQSQNSRWPVLRVGAVFRLP